MEYWEGPARWINTILLVIVAVIGFDTLFRLLHANEENVIVGTVATVAGFFLSPFVGMFPDQEFLLTAIIAVLGYSLLAGIALAVTRSIQASRRARARRRAEAQGFAPPGGPQALPGGPTRWGAPDPGEDTRPLEAPRAADATRPVGGPPSGEEGPSLGEATPHEDPTRSIERPRPRAGEGTGAAPRRGPGRDSRDGDRTHRLS